MYKCINCIWKGEEVTDKGKCPVCGDETKKIGEEIKEEETKETIKLPKDKKKLSRVKDFVSDIVDDGKRNYSNRKRKK